MTGALSNAFTFMGGIIFSAGAADYVMTIMGLGVDEFAWLTVPLVFSGVLGSWIATPLVARLGPGRAMHVAIGMMFLAGGLGVAIGLQRPSGLLPYLVCPLFYSVAMAFCRPVVMVANLNYFPRRRGLGASMQQCFMTGGFGVSAGLWAPLILGRAWMYGAVALFAAAMTALLWHLSMRARPAALAALREDGA